MRTKPNVCFIDTSAFIALNHPKDNNHLRAVGIASHLNMFLYMVTDAVITETYALLRYRLGFHTANRFLKMVLYNEEYRIVDITSSMRSDAYRLLNTYNDHKISYCDALSVMVMKAMKVDEIFAFDHHYEMMDVRLIERRL